MHLGGNIGWIQGAAASIRRLWVRLHENGGKRHEMPCHHNLDIYLHAYIDGCGLTAEPKGVLFLHSEFEWFSFNHARRRLDPLQFAPCRREDSLKQAIEDKVLGSERRSRENGWSYVGKLTEHLGNWPTRRSRTMSLQQPVRGGQRSAQVG